MKSYLSFLFSSLLIALSLAGCKPPVPTISNRYKESIKEYIQVDIPEVYEAMQVALSLTDTYQSDPNTYSNGYPDVQLWASVGYCF